MDKKLLEILCCPVSRTPLRMLKRNELDSLNHDIGAGQVDTVVGEPVRQALTEGLVTTDGKVIYRIDDGIPVLLGDHGIGTTQLQSFG